MQDPTPDTRSTIYEAAYAEGYDSRCTKDCLYKKGTDEYKAWHAGISQYYLEQNSVESYANASYNN